MGRFGEKLCKIRLKKCGKKCGITQERLADQCRVVRQTINCIENNKYDPTLALAFKMADILNVKVDELFIYE
jgi:putative transcriptional regulator